MQFLGKFLNRNPNRDEFAKIVLEALAKGGITNTRYDAGGFMIHVGDGNNKIFLDNSYTTYCGANRRQRRELVARFAGVLVPERPMPAAYPAARPNLLPIVRAASYLSLVELALRSKGVDISTVGSPVGNLADGLVTLLAHDTRDAIQQISASTLEHWRVGFDEALAIATDNLREKTDPRLFRQITPGVYHGEWRDSYESARLLLTDMFYRLDLDGDPVAFVPNRNELWVTGSRNTTGLRTLLENGERSHFVPYALSPDLYALLDSQWQVYTPEDPTVRNSWLSLHRKRDAVDYDQQKTSLDAIQQKEKTDVFFASCTIFKRKDGSEYSACVWTKGIDSLLPKTDRIVFLPDPPNKISISIPWEVAFSIVSGLMDRHPSLLPPRYRVRSFPSEGQIEQLRQFASK